MSSLVVGVDLCPIKPIQGCIALQADITTDKCRTDLKKELKTAKADVVLHDGAPNVGQNWISDAYQQSLITLSAFKLATEFLCRGGWFVTKVFRSKDYQSLMWVFGQFFKKVHATKPQASRNESAEIFVVCQYYLAPDKIDPKFVDPKAVFTECVEDKQPSKDIINPEKKKKKGNREGYEDGATILYKEAKASDFIMGTETIKILNESNAIVIDTPRIEKHPRTTTEIKECIKDLKVLGMKDLRMLKKWRDALKKEFEEKDEANRENDEAVVPAIQVRTQEEIEAEEMDELDKQVADLKDEERRAAKRQKKKELKAKQKIMEKINLKMIIPGGEGPTASESGLFRMSDVQSKTELDKVTDNQTAEDVVEDSEDDDNPKFRPKYEKYIKENTNLDSEGLWYNENDQNDEAKDGSSDEESDNGEDLGLDSEEAESDEEADEKIEKQNEESNNPLIMSLSNEDTEGTKARKAEQWFSKIGDFDEDSDLEEAEIERAVKIVEKKGGSIKKKAEHTNEAPKQVYHSDSEDDDDSDDDKENSGVSDSDDDDDDEAEVVHKSASGKVYNKDGFEVVPQQKIKKRKALSCEELALGEKLIRSKKAKRDIMDNGWHRYMFDDDNLPDWFAKEEEFHMKKELDVDPETVEKYRQMGKEMNVKTIKKVVEAKARRKRKVAKKMEQARKKSANILENEDLGSREKAKEINKLYKKAAAAGARKKEVKYVVAKKFKAQKKAQRPGNVKGPYKQVNKIQMIIDKIFLNSFLFEG